MDTRSTPCYHIVESWNIEKMMEEPPLMSTMMRYARIWVTGIQCSHLLDHLVSLEAFLDTSILFGFSFGVGKPEVCVAEGKLLGTQSGGNGVHRTQSGVKPLQTSHL